MSDAPTPPRSADNTNKGPTMDDAEIKRLRDEQSEWAKVLGQADDVMERSESLLMATPSNPVVRVLVAVTRWVHRRVVEGETKARDKARATYLPGRRG